MNQPIYKISRQLAAIILSVYCATSLAVPKAAEHADAPVTMGADVAKPQASKKQVKPQATEKTRKAAAKKPAVSSKPKTKTKAVQSRK